MKRKRSASTGALPRQVAGKRHSSGELVVRMTRGGAGTVGAHSSDRTEYSERSDASVRIPLDADPLAHGSRGSPALSWHTCQHFLTWMDERRELVLRAGESV